MNFLKEKFQCLKGSVSIARLTCIATEVCRVQMSDTLERFSEIDNELICDTLNWKKEPHIFRLIASRIKASYSGDDEPEFIDMLLQHGSTGFLAEVEFGHCAGFKGKTHVNPGMFTVFPGLVRSQWVYADTFDELIYKIDNLSLKVFAEMFNEDTSNKPDVSEQII